MTTTPQVTDTHEKARDWNTGGFVEYIADFDNATLEQRAQDGNLSQLDGLHDDLGLPTNHIDNTRYLDDDISMRGGNSKGEKAANTRGGYALVMLNNKGEPVNAAAYMLNSDKPPFISDTTQASAYAIGSMSHDSEWWLVTSLSDAVTLYANLAITDPNVTVLACLNKSMFDKALKHFSEVKTINFMDTAQHQDAIKSRLAGVNAVCYFTIDAMLDRLNDGDLIGDLIAGAQAIDLAALAWGNPRPINHSLPPVTSITPDMLPDTLYRYALNAAHRLSVPLEFVAAPLVVTLGSVIGTKVAIMPKNFDDWDIVPNLWGVIVGRPSSKKSPSISAAMKPIDNLASMARAAHELDKQAHDTQKLINQTKAKAADDELKKMAKQLATQSDDADEKITDDDLHKKAATIAESKAQDDTIPTPRRHMVSDITMEKLGEIENQNNNGVLQYRDELSGFLAHLDKEGEQETRTFYLEGFDGNGSKFIDRIGRGSLFVENHCLSVIGGIQPDKIEMYLEKTMRGLGNDGLMQRFQMMVYPDPLPRTKEKDIAVDKQSRDDVYSLFKAADELYEGTLVRYGAHEPNEYYKRPYFRFASNAYPVFMNWYDELIIKADEAEHEVIAQHLLKYGRLIPALALIFHLVECIEHGSGKGGVTLTALQAAIKWGDMLETHMLRVYSCITDNSHLKASLLSAKILGLLKKPSAKTDKTDWVSHGFTARSLKRKNWKGLTDDDAVQTALDVLIEYDWLKYETVSSTGQGGRPTERYWINPKLKSFI